MSIVSRSLKDKIGFGKYSLCTVEEVLNADPGYLVWLRDAKKDNKHFFQRPIHVLLNLAITRSKSLRGKYKVWTNEEMPESNDLPSIPNRRKEDAAGASAEVDYGTWGAF